MYVGTSHRIQLPQDEPICPNCLCILRLPLQLLHPYRLPWRKFLVLHRSCANPAPRAHGWYLNCEPLALELCGQHGHSCTYMSSVDILISANAQYQVAIETIGWKYYLVFLIISAIILPVVYFGYPETMGRSLEELEVMFTEGKSIPAIVSMSRKPFTGSIVPEDKLEKMDKNVSEEEFV